MSASKCIFILSAKSSGSSILQSVLQEYFGLSLAASRGHFENETLYWTKAASVLGREQIKLPFSEVPIPAARAQREIQQFLKDNNVAPISGVVTEAALDGKFAEVCQANGPVFLEKSPHNLYEKEALALIENFAENDNNVEVKLIGLVRNPVATVYSAWQRFGVLPWVEEKHWCDAYRNLKALQSRHPDAVKILRYEDLASGKVDLDELGTYLGLKRVSDKGPKFHAGSIEKWRQDKTFGFKPGAETIAIASEYGYSDTDLKTPDVPWPARNLARHWLFACYHRVPQGLRQVAVNFYRKNFKNKRR